MTAARKPRFQLRNAERTLAVIRRIDPPQSAHGGQVDFEQVVFVRHGDKADLLRIQGFEMWVPCKALTYFAMADELKEGWTGKVRVLSKWARENGLL